VLPGLGLGILPTPATFGNTPSLAMFGPLLQQYPVASGHFMGTSAAHTLFPNRQTLTQFSSNNMKNTLNGVKHMSLDTHLHAKVGNNAVPNVVQQRNTYQCITLRAKVLKWFSK
jgi:hypothetical protein